MRIVSWIFGAAVALSAAHSVAATLPVSVEFSPGSVIAPGPLPGRDNPNAALAGPDGNFLSLGFGGTAVFDFGELFASGGFLDVTEVTFLQFGPHVEIADIYVSDSFTSGDFALGGFTSVGSLLNADAQTDAKFFVNGPFRYVAFRDVSPIDGGSFDGFDIDVVTATPVPLPAAAWMLLSAFAGTAFLFRGRRSSDV